MSTLTIQPSTADTYLRQSAVYNNFGGEVSLQVASCYDSYEQIFDNSRIISEFDFHVGLPAGAVISAATLSLSYYSKERDPVGRTYWVYELTQTGWVELEASWGTYKTGIGWAAGGGDYITDRGASQTVPASYGWMSWDVLDLVQHFQSSHANVAHLLIRDGTENAALNVIPYQAYFRSSDYTTDTTLCPKLVITYTSGTNLVVQDGTQGQEVNNEVLTQVHNIAVASGIQAQTVENIVLTQAHVLIPANGLQGQAVGNVVLTQVHALAVAGGVQAQAADNAVLTQAHNLAVADGAQGQSVGNVLLTQAHTLAVANGSQAQAVDDFALTQIHILSVSGGNQVQAAGNVAPTQAHNLAVASGLQDQTVDNILLDLATFLTVADGTQGQSVGNVILAQIHNLAVFGGVQAQTAEDVILTQDHNLAVAGGAQAQAVGNVVLTTTAPPTSPIKVLLVSGNMIIQVG